MKKIIRQCCEKLFFQAPNPTQQQITRHFHGKSILITGASFGIGEALASSLAQVPCQLILVARSIDKLATLKQQLEPSGCKVILIQADLYDENAADLINNALKQQQIQIDILIHNAGKSIQRSIWNTLDRPQDIQRTIAINYLNPAQLTRLLLPDLQQTHGQVAVVSTINAKLFAPPLWSSYQASKTAMQQWILAIQPELAVHQISASLIYMPLVRTRMIAPTQHYQNMPAMTAQQAAQSVLYSLIQRKRQWQPWWLGIAQVCCYLFAIPIYHINTRLLKKDKK